ncbi:MAG: peptidase S8, partial [Gammaproteobacteria bacterium]
MNMNFKRALLPTLIAGITLTTSAQKAVPNGWHLADPGTSGYNGISLDKAYQFLNGKKSQTVVVAVIDSGIDTTHEDLKPILWTNPKEIPGNGIDDDKNGYVDDVHGWNFLGGKDGRNVGKDSYEAARVYHRWKEKFGNITDPSQLSPADKDQYTMWTKAKNDAVKDVDMNSIALVRKIYDEVKRGDSVIAKDLGKTTYSVKDLKTYNPTVKEAEAFKRIMVGTAAQNNNNTDITNRNLLDEIESEISKADAATTAPQNYRGDIVKDNEADINDRFYGNNDVMAIGADHGTHVSGIIAAARGNKKGMDGIASNVRIMMVRAV